MTHGQSVPHVSRRVVRHVLTPQSPGAPPTRHGTRWMAVAFALAALVARPPHAAAQAGSQGTIAGVVQVEGAQRPLSGAQVSVEGQAGKEAVTDASGRFRITG